jgi:hypothetical protein
MRGFLSPAVRHQVNDTQRAFRALSRHRRTKLAKAAQTTLIKADQWSRGDAVAPEVAKALETGVKTLGSKKK